MNRTMPELRSKWKQDRGVLYARHGHRRVHRHGGGPHDGFVTAETLNLIGRLDSRRARQHGILDPN